MPFNLKSLHQIDETSFDYIVETDVDISLKTTPPNTDGDPLLIRANVYRPKAQGRYPVLVTCGPYGKDIPYEKTNPASFALVNSRNKSPHSAWEVPEPKYWTAQGYAIVRADERGTGNSPGKLDTLSASTYEGFFDIIEWSADQIWSNGKVGLLGISYFAASQWQVASRNPRGLAAIVPWEGITDIYRQRVRHGGILCDKYIQWVSDNFVGLNQYGLPGRKDRIGGPGNLEGDLSPEDLAANLVFLPEQALTSAFIDDPFFGSKHCNIANVRVPVLTAANWGSIHLHLRGSVAGFMGASSQFKYIYFLTGRHDLPFFTDEAVELQTSFFDACLKGDDRKGWLVPGKLPPVNLCLRRGDPGHNNAEAERKTFPRRMENEWPIARTRYIDFHLQLDGTLSSEKCSDGGVVRWEAPEGGVRFKTEPLDAEVEITGHSMARLSVALARRESSSPSEIDLFVTLRHYNASGAEIFYTGAVGDAVPVVRGWLRVSLRKTGESSLGGTISQQTFSSADVQEVAIGEIYTVDVEIWPTSVVLQPGETLELQVTGSDSEGIHVFQHSHLKDRPLEKLKGYNEIHLGPQYENFLRLPVIPQTVW